MSARRLRDVVKNDARLEVRLPSGLLGRLPAGGRERSEFVRRALEAALAEGPRHAGAAFGVPERDPVARPSSAASPRAPEFKCPAGHGVVAGAGPKGRCYCNRKVVPA